MSLEELNKSLGPIEIHKGFWFKYEDKTFVFKGLKGNQPEFLEMNYNYSLMDLDITKKSIKTIDPTSIKCDKGHYEYKEDNMAVDQKCKWLDHTTKLTLKLSNYELERWQAAKDFILYNNKMDFDKKLAFMGICNFIKDLDTNDMNIIEALFYNKFTNKTFVKNSWSEEARQELQMFYENNRKYTQKKDKVDSSTSQINLDSTRYSIYKGNWESQQGFEQRRRDRLKELELKIGPLYNEFKEYENLKKDLNL